MTIWSAIKYWTYIIDKKEDVHVHEDDKYIPFDW